MIDKLIFLTHSGSKIPPQAGTYSANPTTGFIVLGVFVIIGIILWYLFTRKRGIY